MPMVIDEWMVAAMEEYRSGNGDKEQPPTPRQSERQTNKRSAPKFLFQSEAVGSNGGKEEEQVGSGKGVVDDGDGCSNTVSEPIFIPSKGRYTQRNFGTHVLLSAAGIPFTLVVEPHEAQQYGDLLMSLPGFDADKHKVAVLPRSNQGISYVRNAILRNFTPPNGWFWVMDDDIRAFNQAIGGKNREIPPQQLFAVLHQRFRKYPNISLFSLEYDQFSYSYGEGDVAVNSYNNIAIRVNKDLVPSSAHYRFSIREDYDFTLQLIVEGGSTLRFRDLSFRVPKMCACTGGMTDYYNEKKAEIRLQNRLFLEQWPSISREVLKGSDKDIRYDIRVLWIKLNPLKGADPVAVLTNRTPLPEVELKLPASRKVLSGEGKQPRAQQVAGAKRTRPTTRITGRGRKSRRATSSRSPSSESCGSTPKSSSSFHSSEFEEASEETLSSETDESELIDSFDMEAYEATIPVRKRSTVVAPPKQQQVAVTTTAITTAKTTSSVAKVARLVPPKKAAAAPKTVLDCAPKLTVQSFFKNAPKKATPAVKGNESVVKQAPGWRGYGVAWYRELSDSLANQCGLFAIPPSQVSVGDTVYIVPEKIAVTPSVMEGTVIDRKHEKASPSGFGFSVVPSRGYRGVEVQYCSIVYSLRSVGGDGVVSESELGAVIKAVDEVIQPPPDALTVVTPDNVDVIEGLLRS